MRVEMRCSNSCGRRDQSAVMPSSLATARKAGNLYVDSYEKTVGSAIELERKVAGLTRQEWLKSLLEAQADFASELTHSYTSAARALLR